ncbi:MAG: glucan biosynthesis protein G [Halothiobacillaceae bacterium]|nr:glucan biosynthesis protein G [Halothiobacillaceae bacterium]HUN00862.1 glucan biosynthesis protein G [Halothiobacillus sp.]
MLPNSIGSGLIGGTCPARGVQLSAWGRRFGPLILASFLGSALFFTTVAQAFDLNDVNIQAKQLAASGYVATPKIPEALSQIDQATFDRIAIKPSAALWPSARFGISPIAAGFMYQQPVSLYEVTAQSVAPVVFDKAKFDWPSPAFAQMVPANLGFAGFSVDYPLTGQDSHDVMITFLGGAQFGVVAANQVPGAHARGVAIDTGLPQGEKFPMFTKFWLVRPESTDSQLTIYALLDGESLTGAYEFVVRPNGDQVDVQVTANLFPRNGISRVGLAPMSTMYYYGQIGQRPAGQWRPAAYESDGLLMHTGEGNWVFRSLRNPSELRTNQFDADGIRGFGFMQRQTRFCQFEDPISRFEKRPSLWVTTEAGFGKGKIVLVQIPTNSDVHENQIAFFQPADPVDPDHPLSFAYTLSVGNSRVADEPLAEVRRPLIGTVKITPEDKTEKAYRVNLDFAGGKLSGLSNNTPVIAQINTHDTANVLEQAVIPLPEPGHWRLSMLLAPTSKAEITLDANLALGKKLLSETWRYELPADLSRFGQMK